MGGYGYYGGYGMGYGGDSSLGALLTVAGVLFIASQFLRTGGSNFAGADDEGSLGSGSNVVKINIGLDADWGPGNVMDSLRVIASKNEDLSSRQALSNLLSDACLVLLRKQNDWNSVAFEKKDFSGNDGKKTESNFQKLSIEERSKFERENVNSPMIKSSSSDMRTQAVVSIVVAMKGRGQSLSKNVYSRSELKSVLQVGRPHIKSFRV